MSPGKRVPQVGDPLVLVGFGITAEDADDDGTKRVTTNTISSVHPTWFEYLGPDDEVGNTCNGDSGGPALRVDNGRDVVIGVHVWGDTACLEYGQDLRVDAFVDWIAENAGDDPGLPDQLRPVVRIAAPADGSTTPSDFVVRATASDADSGLAKIALFIDDQQARTTTSSPVAFKVADLASGNHSLTIEATDRAGNRAAQVITITVQEHTALLPGDDSVLSDDSSEAAPAAEAATTSTRPFEVVGSCALTSGAPAGSSAGPLFVLAWLVLLRRRWR